MGAAPHSLKPANTLGVGAKDVGGGGGEGRGGGGGEAGGTADGRAEAAGLMVNNCCATKAGLNHLRGK